MTGGRTTSPTVEPLDRDILRLVLAVVLGSIMSVLDTTIVNVALDNLSQGLHSPISTVQWVVTAYLLAMGAVIPISGWATRRFGTKRLYIMSLALFVVGSAACGLAGSIAWLIVFRVVQGLGGGLILPVGQTILARSAGPRRMGRVLNLVGIPTVLAPIIGPTVGGLILEHLDWHWIFFVNVPVGVAAVVLAVVILPPDRSQAGGSFDRLGLALLGVGLPAAIYGLSEIQGGTPARWAIPLVVGLGLIVLFAWHAARIRNPLLDVRLYANTAFSAASVATFALGAGAFGGMILLPLYYEMVRHLDPVMTGLLLVFQGIGVAISMSFTGTLVDRIGGGIVSTFGAIVFTAGTAPLAFVTGHTSEALISLTLVVRGLGMGACMMPAMAAAFAVLTPDQVHDASPQLNVLQRVGGSLGTAILAVVLDDRLTAVTRAAGGHPTADALAGGYRVAYWWTVAFTVVTVVPTAFLAVVERRARRSGVQVERVPPGGEPVGEPLPRYAD